MEGILAAAAVAVTRATTTSRGQRGYCSS
uniref:Uncharacterized protein n=2 Tax=Anguilla anguilla TaxID=7936 RepID=A0A0E9STS4_ANGAN